MKKQCDECAGHCWHVTSSTTDGLAQKGWHDETCCWCGLKRKNHWRVVRDANHGNHVPSDRVQTGVKYEYPKGQHVNVV